MAAQRSATEKRELAAFVTDLYQWGGYATQAEWARDSGYPAPNLSEVMGATATLDGYNLMRLYKAAEARAASERPVTVDDDADLRALLQRLVGLTRELTTRLGLEAADG